MLSTYEQMDHHAYDKQLRWCRRFRYRRDAIVSYSDLHAELLDARALNCRFLHLPTFWKNLRFHQVHRVLAYLLYPRFVAPRSSTNREVHSEWCSVRNGLAKSQLGGFGIRIRGSKCGDF